MKNLSLILLLIVSIMTVGCGTKEDLGKWSAAQVANPVTDRTYIRDSLGRYIYINGVNLADTKLAMTTAPKVSYVGRPIPEKQADEFYKKLQSMGFNAVRFLVSWEGIEHDGPGKYDQAYLDYIRRMVKKAQDYGLWVLIDFHQDMFARAMFVKFNHHPKGVQEGSLEYQVLSLFEPYDDRIQGDGAPAWVVHDCLPEKKFDSPAFGIPRILGNLTDSKGNPNTAMISRLVSVIGKVMGGGSLPTDTTWMKYVLNHRPPHFGPDETTDLLPLTNWGINLFLSLDLSRLYACFFASQDAMPDLMIQGRPASDFLQDDYADAYAEVVKKVSDLPNILGYDIINEPSSMFVSLAAAGLFAQTGSLDSVKGLMEQLFGLETGDNVYQILIDLQVLPPDTKPDTLRAYGLSGINTSGVLGLLFSFDRNYLQPFYEKVSQKILANDPDAIIFFEPSGGLAMVLSYITGPGNPMIWTQPMTRLKNVPMQVYAPHYYPDIYPYLGLNQPPRTFVPGEIAQQDYSTAIKGVLTPASRDMDNTPAVVGEFGTYFNFNGIQNSVAQNYAVSAEILDNYYESFEKLFTGRMIWCASTHNEKEDGEGWNHEDFSIFGPDGKPRAAQAFQRPVPLAISGKPVAMHYYSPLHYFDPDKGVYPRLKEFELDFASKETDAATEIYVPMAVYDQGFYVFLSDGWAHYDRGTQRLFFMPAQDRPGWVHKVVIRPPLPGTENEGWSLFIGPKNEVER